MSRRETNSSEAGFTLIEVIVVVILLGVLVGVAVLSLSSANRTGQISACRTDYQTVSAALAAYKGDRLETLSNLTLYPLAVGEVATGDSLSSLGYMNLLPENGTYRIYLTAGGAAVGVQTKNASGGWDAVGDTANPKLADCELIGYAGQS